MIKEQDTTTKVVVSHRALMARINRKLAHENERLVARRGRYCTDLGDFYIVDGHTNTLCATHVEPAQLGRELGVLKAHEIVADGGS